MNVVLGNGGRRRNPCGRMVPVAVVLVSLLAPWQARAAIQCIAPDNGSGTVDLPPLCPDGYISPDDFHIIVDGLPAGTEIIVDASHDRFLNPVRTPGGTLGGEVEFFQSSLMMQMTGTGDLEGFTKFVEVPLSCEVHTGPRTPGAAVQSFPNAMVAMSGSLGPDPDICNLQITAGSSFGLPSPGHTTLTRLGPPGSSFAVDSFFDITYQIDFQGCPGGPLGGMVSTTIRTVRMQTGLPGIEPGDDFLVTVDPTTLTFGSADVPEIPAGLLGNPDPVSVAVQLAGNGELYDAVVRRLSRAELPSIAPLPGSSDTIPIQLVELRLTSVSPVPIPTAGGDSFFDIFVDLSTGSTSSGLMEIIRTQNDGGIYSCEISVNAEVTFQEVGGTQTGTMSVPVLLASDGSGRWNHDPYSEDLALAGSGPNFYMRGIEHEDIGMRMKSSGGGVIHSVDPPRPPKCYFGEWVNDGSVPPSHVDFGGFFPAIPGGFFGMGSLPFPPLPGQVARVEVRGEPLELETTGGTTVITRSSVEPMPVSAPVGTAQTVDIEIVALSLHSIQPITVQYPGGVTEQWLMAVDLSPTPVPPPGGQMTVQKTHPNGGVFGATFMVQPRFTFERITDGQLKTLDTAAAGIPPIPLSIPSGAPWVHFVEQSAPLMGGGIYVGPGQTWVPGVRQLNPNDRNSQQPELVTADELGPASNVTHLVCPPPPPPPPPPPDPHKTLPTTQVNFSPTTDVPPIPADFFAPGSEPFSGIIILGGSTSADTLIQRYGDMVCPLPPPAPCDPIEIEIVQLDLVGISPITVTSPSGDTQWNVRLSLSDLRSSRGVLQATKTHCNGGTYDGLLPVRPKFTFTNVNDDLDVREFDYAVQGLGEVMVEVSGAHWVQNLDPSVHVEAPSNGTFVPGVEETAPCDSTTQVERTTTWISPGGGVGHVIDPLPLFCQLPGGAADPCAALQATDCKGDPSQLCLAIRAVVGPLGDFRADTCDCLTPGTDCGPIEITNGGNAVTCPGFCQPPQTPGPCVVFYDDGTGTGPQTNGNQTEPAGVFPSGTELWCDCETTAPPCGPATIDGQACAPLECSDGSTDPCQARCVEYNPVTGATMITNCDCRPLSECHVTFEPATGLRDGTDNPCVVPESPPASGTITLPPLGCPYLSQDEVHAILGDAPITVTLELDPIHIPNFCGQTPADPGPGCPPPGLCEDAGGDLGGNKDCFESNLHLVITGNDPPLAGYSHTIDVPVSCLVFTAPRTPGDPVQSFDTEMFRLEGQLFGDPDFCQFQVTAGRTFGLPSPGHTTLTRLPSGDYHVDSFFDIFYEIDFQGCAGGPLNGYHGSTTGTIRMSTGTTPKCTGVCPVGTVCNELREVDPATGLMTICCDCEIPSEPLEACCAADGSCQNLPPSECRLNDGTPRGPGTACAGVDVNPANNRDDACEFDDECDDCGPGAHWIDTCPGGQDYMPSGAPVGIDLNLDCIQDQTLVLTGPVAVNRAAGVPHQIVPTEMVSMHLTGGGVTLRAGAGGGQGGVLPPSLGAINEQSGDPAQGDSFFDVFFELEYAAGQYAYNHTPLTVQSKIPCVPPKAIYFHPVACIPLYQQPFGTCTLSGAVCRTDVQCGVAGGTCDHGLEVARLTRANHVTYPDCGPPTADGQACAPFECNDGTTDPCQPRCVDYDPVTGISTVVDCDCRPQDECHVKFTPTTGTGLRTGGPDPCVVPEDPPLSGTVTLPPLGCPYLSQDEVHAILGDPPITVTLELDPIHIPNFCGGAGTPQGPGCPPPGLCETAGGALGGNTDCFESNLHLEVSGNTAPLAGYSHVIDVPVSCLVYTGPRTPGDPVQSFDTEMFRLQGQLFGDPDFCTFTVTAGRQYGMPSPGHTTLTRLPSGDYHVDSFFDIEYQIDFQGCAGGPLDGYQGSTTGTIRMGTGTAPSCEGVCPAGTICSERRTMDADTGVMTVCCDCLPEPTGACCRASGICAVTTPSNCPAPDQYLGDGTVCQGMGACCLDVTNGPAQYETCQMMDGACCELAGGVFDAGGTCTTVACCLPGGFCENLDPQCCTASGGVVSGAACSAATCTPQPCQVGSTGWCEQVACPGGSTEQCQAKCVQYDPVTDTTVATSCDCIPGGDCYVKADAAGSGGRGGDPCVLPPGPPGTVTLPPIGCDYLSPEEVHMIVAGLPVPTTIELAAIHKDFVCGHDIQCTSPPPPGLSCESNDGEGTLGGKVDCFESLLDLTVQGTGILSTFSRHLFVQAEVEVHTAPRIPGSPVQDFDTEMFRLQGQLVGDPDFCTLRITAGSSFGLPSPGHTTLTRLSGGNFVVDSFFDIEYQIEFQGCPGSVLEGFGGTTTGTIRMETGGMPNCSQTCPAGARCERTTIFDPASDTFEVCCNCVEDAPTPRPARPPYDRKMNRILAWDPGTGGRALADPIAYRVELKELTLGSCDGTGGFCRQNRNKCSISMAACTVDGDCPLGQTCVNTDCGVCSGNGKPCIHAAIDCPPGQTCNQTGETCLNDAPDVGGNSVGTIWWVGPECPTGSGQHLLVTEAFRKEANSWSLPTFVGDCEIAPQAVYGIRSFNVNTLTLSGELPVETTLFAPISVSYWADAVGPLQRFCDGDINGTPCVNDAGCVFPELCKLAWTLPDGAVNFDDIQAGIWAWTLPPNVTIPPKAWMDLHGNACGLPASQNYDPPNNVINSSDIQGIVFGFSGRPYTYYDPADCPGTTWCDGILGGTACTSDGDCTFPATCQVVCCSP